MWRLISDSCEHENVDRLDSQESSSKFCVDFDNRFRIVRGKFDGDIPRKKSHHTNNSIAVITAVPTAKFPHHTPEYSTMVQLDRSTAVINHGIELIQDAVHGMNVHTEIRGIRVVLQMHTCSGTEE